MSPDDLFVIGLAVFAILVVLALAAAPFFLVRGAKSRLWLAAQVAVPIAVGVVVAIGGHFAPDVPRVTPGLSVFASLVFLVYLALWFSIQVLVVIVLGVNRLTSRHAKVEVWTPAVAALVSLALGVVVALMAVGVLFSATDDSSQYLRGRDAASFAESLGDEPSHLGARHRGGAAATSPTECERGGWR